MSAEYHKGLLDPDEFRSIIATAADGFLMVDLAGHILDANDSYCKLMGYSRDELQKKHISEFDPIDNMEDVAKRAEEIIRAGSLRFESKHLHKNGTAIDVEISSNYSSAHGGSFFSFIRDISSQKRTREIVAVRLSLMEYARNHSVDELLRMALDEAEVMTGSSIGFYHLLESDQQTLTLHSWSSRTASQFCKAEGSGNHYHISQAGVWADCVRERQPVIHNDYPSLPHRQGMPDGHAAVVRELVVPVFRNEKIVAIMGIGNKPADYDQHDVDLITLLADIAWGVAEHKLYEAALKISEERYRNIVENQTEFVDRYLPGGILTYVNDSLLKFAGLPAVELLGKSFYPFIHESDRDETISIIESISNNNPIVTTESRIVLPDGSMRWNHWTHTGFFDKNGVIVEYQSVGRDITERKRFEEEIQRLNRLYNVLSQVNFLLAKACSPEELTQQVCQAAVDRGGFLLTWIGVADQQNFQVKPIASAGNAYDYINGLIIYTDDRPEGLGPTGTAIREGRPYICNDYFADPRTLPWRKKAEQAGIMASAAFPFTLAGNQYGVFSIYGSEVNFFQKKEIALLEEVAMNISFGLDHLQQELLRKKAEDDLEKSRSLLRATARKAKMGGWEIDLQTRKLIWTEQLYIIYEVEPDFKPTFNSVLNFCDAESKPLLAKSFRRASNTGDPFDLQLTIITAKKNVRIVHVVGVANFQDGKPVKVSGTFQDITVQRRLEEQLRQSLKMESIGRLAGGVAHDFNNKLSVILGYAEMLKMKYPDNQELQDELSEITKAAEHSRDTTRQLLAFSRQQLHSPTTVNLNKIIEETQRTLPRLIGEDIAIKFELAPGLWMVRIDPTQVDQIIMNLVVNSRDAMPKGGQLTLSTANTAVDANYCLEHLDAKSGEYVQMTIADTGHGIDRETLKHIFEPFFTTKEVGKGTGLGLSTIYGIVTQNGGFISVVSDPGDGTRFNIFLPRLAEEAIVQPQVVSKLPKGSGIILIVEDDISLSAMLKTMLQHIGYTVLSTASPQEAITLCSDKATRIDLMLIDVVMPGMNGKEMMDIITPVRPDIKSIFMSGYSSDILSQMGIKEGSASFIQKPFKLNVLNEKIVEVMNNP